MSAREERVGLNEAVFRELNERLENLAETFQVGNHGLDLVCECGDISCINRISMSPADYKAVRAEPAHFAVYPGHWIANVERVIAQRKTYNVVEKTGDAAKVAEATDPRH